MCKNLKIILVFFCLLGIISSVEAKSTDKSVRDGNKFFKEGDYASSIKEYNQALEKNLQSDVLNFNLGTALYKKGDYDAATDHLEQSLLSDKSDIKEKAHYNLGNTLYQFGIKHENDNLQNAISSLEKSLTHYERALELDMKDRDAKDNQEFVKKELDRLKKKQKDQQSQKNQQQNGQQKQDKQQDQKQDQQQSQQNSQEQNKENEHQNHSSQDKKEQSQPSQENKSGEEKENQNQGQAQQKQDKKENSQEQSAQQVDNSKDKDKESQRKGSEQKAQQSVEQKSEESQNGKTPEALTTKEAQMLLEGYEQTEEPKGMLQFYKGSNQSQPVLKDW